MTAKIEASKSYSTRSNAIKAARKALGHDAKANEQFLIVEIEGGFAFEPVRASRFATASIARIDDETPGMKRLRASKDAEKIRLANLADQEHGRAEALAKIEAKAATEIKVTPDAILADGTMIELKTASSNRREIAKAPRESVNAASKAQAPAKREKNAPKDGTRARSIFDMLARDGGATAKDLAASGLKDVSVAVWTHRFAERYGFDAVITKDGSVDRCALAAKASKAA
jgi:hypothetical protein